MATHDRPNILVLLNDHQAHYRHGWDNGPHVARPHFDQLARGGAVFQRAYASSPLCSPARRSILTGVHPHRHGEIKNDTNHPFDLTTYLDVLSGAGYDLSYFGKWHSGAGTAADHGCHGFSYPSYNNPYTKPEYKEYLAARGLPDPRIRIERIFDHKDYQFDSDGLYTQDNDWCNEHASGVMEAPNDAHEAFFLANLACDELEKIAQQPDGKPFAMRVDFWGPHQPYFPTREYADLYDAEDIPVYPNFADDLATKPDVYWSEGNRDISRDGRLIVPSTLPWAEWQKVMARAYAQATLTDAAGGRVLAKLEELGLAENTVVMWSTDHGDALASHGGHFDKRSYLSEEMVRVPLAMRYPAGMEAGQHRYELVSNLDIGPTILDACGLTYGHKTDGASLLALTAGNGRDSWRTEFVSETHGHAEDVIGRALITQRYKFADYGPSGRELYDLATDPYELHNLLDDPAFAAVLADLAGRLDAWRSTTGDSASL